jgi:hypothetical protein
MSGLKGAAVNRAEVHGQKRTFYSSATTCGLPTHQIRQIYAPSVGLAPVPGCDSVLLGNFGNRYSLAVVPTR